MNPQRASSYTFDAFRNDIRHRVRLLNRRLRDPGATWPGALFLDLPGEGLAVETFELSGGASENRELSTRVIPDLIAASDARRACWVMPVWRFVQDQRQECLLLVFAEPGRCEVTLAEVHRDDVSPPRLGRWNDGAFGPGARRASGLFVDPLLAALERRA